MKDSSAYTPPLAPTMHVPGSRRPQATTCEA
eukprot:CAMPEP_0195049096 /NCGR_PEP_ID=MMETSP0347-20130606/53253_1 /TAXON_ID=2932 /ORGANISM="Alexandrium fundyense, Strain CCMP1719" /LENGTH=30 /DNA_ID= /DNA_START= /DNA_END= /DNA_ORIENTATION=